MWLSSPRRTNKLDCLNGEQKLVPTFERAQRAWPKPAIQEENTGQGGQTPEFTPGWTPPWGSGTLSHSQRLHPCFNQQLMASAVKNKHKLALGLRADAQNSDLITRRVKLTAKTLNLAFYRRNLKEGQILCWWVITNVSSASFKQNRLVFVCCYSTFLLNLTAPWPFCMCSPSCTHL